MDWIAHLQNIFQWKNLQVAIVWKFEKYLLLLQKETNEKASTFFLLKHLRKSETYIN